jgi:hypothetical protein
MTKNEIVNEIDYELRTNMTNSICVMGSSLSSMLFSLDKPDGLSKKKLRKHLEKIHASLIEIQNSKDKVVKAIIDGR